MTPARSIHVLYLLAVLCRATCAISSSNNKDTNTVKLDDVLNGNYNAVAYEGVWISDAELEYRNDQGDIWIHHVVDGTHKLLVNVTNPKLPKYPADRTFSLSPDRKFLLVKYNVEKVWRHSTLANYDLYNLETQTFEREIRPLSGSGKVSSFQWSNPKGNAFIIVFNRDIYYAPSAISPAKSNLVEITSDARSNGKISNGLADWVYEEEMFGNSNALWFSQSGAKLAFVKFNDASVGNFKYPLYGEPGDRGRVYPKWIDIYYPKTGTSNPTVQIYTSEFTSPKTSLKLLIPTDVKFPEYIASVKWLTESTLLLLFLNRQQTELSYYHCQLSNARCALAHKETSKNGWMDNAAPKISKNGNSFLQILSRDVVVGGFKRHYKQLVQLNIGTNNKVTDTVRRTSEQFNVESIVGWDETTGNIYFKATKVEYDDKSEQPIANPVSSQIYVIGAKNGKAHCLTCALENAEGQPCQMNSASFSTLFSQFVHFCTGPGVPEVNVLKNNKQLTKLALLQGNDKLRKVLGNIELPQIKDYSIALSAGSYILIRLLLPKDFDESEKYPLLIDVYAGPGSQKVRDNYKVDWGVSLASDKKVIYGYIDGRGSGGQSVEMLHQLKGRLGTIEVEDQIYATRWLLSNVPFIDSEHIGIWGWSYGGYVTAMVLATDTNNIFKCGIAVAPVTNWLYYDTIYTERFLGLPDSNRKAYEISDVTANVKNFRSKEFLLVHGNADDNVHYQHSMVLSRALEKEDIMFDQLSYPDEDHSIGRMKKHLYHSFEKFLFRNCLVASDEDDIPEKGTPVPSTDAPGSGQRLIASGHIFISIILAKQFVMLL